MRLHRIWLVLSLLAPTPVPGATLSVGPESVDALPMFSPFPPGLVPDPSAPTAAWVALSEPPGEGVDRVEATAGQALAFSAPPWSPYFLPARAELGCTRRPQIGSLSLASGAPGVQLWLTTAGCERAIAVDGIDGQPPALELSGQSVGAIPTDRPIAGSFVTYRDAGGRAIAAFTTGFTSSALRVGDRLLVSTSNFALVGSDPELYPGTVLAFDIEDQGDLLRLAPASPAYLVTSDPNPGSLTLLPGGRVAVVNTGLLDPGFPPLLTGSGSVDILDPVTLQWVGSIPLGPGNPGGRRIAIDPTGSVGVVTSHTFRQLFAVDLRGIGDLAPMPIDPQLQRPSCNDVETALAGGLPCLRERVIHGGDDPLAIPAADGGAGVAGFVPAVAFSHAGDYLAAVSFNDGGLALVAFDSHRLSTPHPLLPTRFSAPEVHPATPPSGEFGTECCPGQVWVQSGAPPGTEGDALLWMTGSPVGVLVRGQLDGTLPDPGGDTDADGVVDADDVCPLESDDDQSDLGGVGPGAGPDEIGDACQCGDLTGDGRVLADDADELRLGLAQGHDPGVLRKCSVWHGTPCDASDAVVLRRGIAGRAPGIRNVCDAFLP